MLETCFKNDGIVEIGIDEAGRGSFWGPIMAGAVIIPTEETWTDKQTELFEQLKDSKKISPKKRERLYESIKELVEHYGIGIVDASEINEHGITWANQEAFRRAVLNIKLEDHTSCRLVIDGVLSIPDWTNEQELVVEGDGKYIAVAAASILAKVHHDKWIQTYCEGNPECDTRYDLCKSKGYGTAKHRDGIRVYGGHELHRLLYIQNWLPTGKGVSQKKTKVGKKSVGVAAADKCLIKF